MTRIPKVENLCVKMPARSVSINSSERVCLNCIWYEQYFRQSRSTIQSWVPVSKGFCGPLRQPCRDYETIRKE